MASKSEARLLVARELHRSMLRLLRAFAAENGGAHLGNDTIYRGIKLGGWARRRRTEYRAGRLADWLIEALEAVPGWSWSPVAARSALKLAALREFVARHGWDGLAVDRRAKVVWRGFDLVGFVEACRNGRRRGSLSEWLALELDAIPGWVWAPRTGMSERRLALLKRYLARRRWSSKVLEHGSRIVVEGVDLRRWLYTCRLQHRKGILAPWLARELEELPGWSWAPRPSLVGAPPLLLRQRVAALREHVGRVGWAGLEGEAAWGVRRRGTDLARWVTECRQRHQDKALPEWLEGELEKIDGWSWVATKAPHADEVGLVRWLVKAFGDEGDRVVHDLVAMAKFVDLARAARRAGTLEPAVARRLARVPGWSWTRSR